MHRFDSGLVIYWHGYDESVDTDPAIVLDDDLRPADCTLLTCAPTACTEPSGRFDAPTLATTSSPTAAVASR